MKLLIISTNIFPLPPAGYSGLEMLAYHLTCGLAAKGHAISVVAPQGSNLPDGVELLATGVNEDEEQSYKRYRGRLEAREWDVIIDASWGRWAMMSSAGRDPELPIVNWFHSDPSCYQSQPSVRYPMWVGVSKSHAENLSRAWRTAVRYVYNGIDTQFYRTNGQPRGERYCWIARYTPEKNCIPPGYPVICNPGVKTIEDIKPGDRVLGHDNLYHTVLQSYRRDYDGELIKLNLWNTVPPLELTPNHPLLVFRFEEHSLRPKWVPAEEVKIGDRLATPVPKAKSGHTRSLKVSDYLTDIKIEGAKTFTFKKGRGNKGGWGPPIPLRIKADKSFLRFCGYYISEGSSIGGNGLEFDFGGQETRYINDVGNIGRDTFGLQSKVRYSKNGAGVRFCSKLLASLFSKWFGSKSEEKRVPEWAWNLSKPLTIELLKGMWFGDGYSKEEIGQTVHRYGTVSQTLAYQLLLILARLGIVAELRTYKPRRQSYLLQYHLIVQQPYAKRMSEYLGIEHKERKVDYRYAQNSKGQQGHFRRRWGKIIRHCIRDPHHHTEQYILHRVSHIEHVPYAGQVFNLETDGAHSYCVNGLAVHNCLDIITLAQKLKVGVDLYGDTSIVGDQGYVRTAFGRADGYFAKANQGISREATVEVYSKAKGFLFLPSWEEMFGLTVVEAMACGAVPIVGRRGAMPELVKDGQTGFVVDSLEQMEELIRKDAVRQIEPKTMRKYVEKRFSVERFVEEWEQLIKEVSNGVRW